MKKIVILEQILPVKGLSMFSSGEVENSESNETADSFAKGDNPHFIN